MSDAKDFNPYVSPQITGRAETYRPTRGGAHPYESGRGRAVVAMVLLGAAAVTSAASGASSIALYQFLVRVNAGDTDLEAAEREDLREMVTGLSEFIIWLAGFIAYLMWVHRVYRNLPALGARKTTQTPGWAVGWYFVPIFSLFRPYQGMKQILRGSDPDGLGYPDGMSNRRYGLLPLWWTLWIISQIIAQGAFRRSLRDDDSIEDAMHIAILFAISSACDIPSILATIFLVRKVDALQTERIEAVEQMPEPPAAGASPDFSHFA